MTLHRRPRVLLITLLFVPCPFSEDLAYRHLTQEAMDWCHGALCNMATLHMLLAVPADAPAARRVGIIDPEPGRRPPGCRFVLHRTSGPRSRPMPGVCELHLSFDGALGGRHACDGARRRLLVGVGGARAADVPHWRRGAPRGVASSGAMALEASPRHGVAGLRVTPERAHIVVRARCLHVE